MKVYVVEVGAYSSRYIDAIFVNREDAEQYVIRTARNSWARHTNGQPFPEPEASPFAEWLGEVERRTGHWGYFGGVEEYELWDSIPALNAVDDDEIGVN